MKVELFNDNFQNYKRYGISKAQLVIADIPYNLGGQHMQVILCGI
nr:MAG TPA: METTL3/METTL14, RNA BINDING PROTEIN [Caudoviricetes sp.]